MDALTIDIWMYNRLAPLLALLLSVCIIWIICIICIIWGGGGGGGGVLPHVGWRGRAEIWGILLPPNLPDFWALYYWMSRICSGFLGGFSKFTIIKFKLRICINYRPGNITGNPPAYKLSVCVFPDFWVLSILFTSRIFDGVMMRASALGIPPPPPESTLSRAE